ncbi:hypothetical protein BCV72DRAFT_218091, partial [Rhizopus microsporus var. microsporus]
LDFKAFFEASFSVFVTYFEKMWLGRKGLWAKAWRSDASFHTNNMIESYHNQLESFYLIRSPNKCVGRVVYTLVNVVLCDYRIEHVQVKFGLKVMPLTTEQSKREKKADEIELNAAQIMVTMSLANDQVVSPLFSKTYVISSNFAS